jgi:DNA-binding transcriptional ArsR family regulator
MIAVERFGKTTEAVFADRRLSTGAKVAYGVLAMFHDAERGCFATQETLSDAGGWGTPRALRRALRELQDAGLVAVERRGQGRPNVYRLARNDWTKTSTQGEDDRTKTSTQGEDDRTKTSTQAVSVDENVPSRVDENVHSIRRLDQAARPVASSSNVAGSFRETFRRMAPGRPPLANVPTEARSAAIRRWEADPELGEHAISCFVADAHQDGKGPSIFLDDFGSVWLPMALDGEQRVASMRAFTEMSGRPKRSESPPTYGGCPVETTTRRSSTGPPEPEHPTEPDVAGRWKLHALTAGKMRADTAPPVAPEPERPYDGDFIPF